MTAREKEVLTTLEVCKGNRSAAARALGTSEAYVRHVLKKVGQGVEVEAVTSIEDALTPKRPADWGNGKLRRYLFTCAQSNTRVKRPAWENLLALRKHWGATLMISTFTYEVESYGRRSVKRGFGPTQEDKGLWWDPEIEPYVADSLTEITPDLMWCGHMNTLPTRVRPLREMESYTGQKCGIFPHAKVALETVPSPKGGRVKMNYTTGACTRAHYIAKTAGFKGLFHHVIGALLVEVAPDNVWFARHLNADGKGDIFDLEAVASHGKVQSFTR